MGKYSEFYYGTTLYGATPVISSLEADTGPSTGQTAFTMLGESLSYQGNDDTFTTGSLDLLKWTDISSGTGSVSTGSSHLSLTTGVTAGSVSGIESANVFGATQFEVKINIPKISQYPDAATNLFSFQMYVDASNYCKIAVNQGITSGTLTLDISCVVAGATVDSTSSTWTTGVCTFKMIRWGSTVYFYANGSLVFTSQRFVATAANFRYYNENLTSIYDTLCTVEYVKMRTFVIFGDQITHDITEVSSVRVRGLTPPSVDVRGVEGSYAGFVDVTVVSQSYITRSNFFEYFFDNSLTISKNNQFGTKLSIIDDATVRTPDSVEKGLGGGK